MNEKRQAEKTKRKGKERKEGEKRKEKKPYNEFYSK